MELLVWKKRLGHEAHMQVQMLKTSEYNSARMCERHLEDKVPPFLEVEMSKKCMALRLEAHFKIKAVKMHKAHHCPSTLGSSDAETLRGLVAPSTCSS